MNEIENAGELDLQEIEALEEYNNTDIDQLSDQDVTHKIRLSMKRRFGYPEWILLFEFPSPDGRLADAIAVNLNTSQNFRIVGFEFKASRSDWLAEKKNGQKSDYFVSIVDEWYVVAGRTGIVEEKELPDGWGLLELKPNSEQLWKLEESELTRHQQGEPDRYFWTRFLKKTVADDSNFSKQDLEEARRRGFAEAKDKYIGSDSKHSDRELKRLRKKAESYDRLQDELDFIPYSSISDQRARTFELAVELIKKVNGDRYGTIRGELDHLHEQLERSMESMIEEAEELEKGFQILQDRIEDGHDPMEAEAQEAGQ